MRTNTILFLLGLSGVCFYAKNAQVAAETIRFPSTSSASRASVITTKEAIQMLERYDIINRFAAGEKNISNDLLYHFMMYQDGEENINDYPYIDTIIELYRRANTAQQELQAQGGEKLPQNEKTNPLRILPVRCLEAFIAEGCVIRDFNACVDNFLEVKPMDAKIMTFLCTKGIASAPHLLNVKNKNGCTPLMIAAGYSTADVCKALIEAGADVNAKTDNERLLGVTALMQAAISGKANVCKVLIEAGADVNAKADICDFEGASALMCAAYCSADVCKILIEAGADVNAKDNGERTALMCAARRSEADVCKILIEAGADVNAKVDTHFFGTKEGETVLMCAAALGKADVCKILIEAGADVNAKDSNGKTALDYATPKSSIYDLLLQNGAKAH